MINFTQVPNELFEQSQLSIPARYLFCLLLRYCGQKDSCFPSQKTLSHILNYSVRYTAMLLNELKAAGLIKKERTGFNRSNTYFVSKNYEKYISYQPNDEKHCSSHLRSRVPFHNGTPLPPIDTYTKEKEKKEISKGFESLRESLTEMEFVRKSGNFFG
jgi:hypothetical protein